MPSVLEVKQVSVAFADGKKMKRRVEDISFSLQEGEVLAVVGESGSGKTVTALTILGILPANGRVLSGEISYAGRDLLRLSDRQMNEIRGKDIAMIFQNVMTGLNPVLTIGYQLTETIRQHMVLSRRESRQRGMVLLKEVGLANPVEVMKKYAHTLSGGMKQRVMIAMALACDPRILIADEPTTALDVTIQAQILSLLKKEQKEKNLSMLMVTHDMGVVAEMADRVMVMYAGQIVEEASVEALFHSPQHPYTRALLQAIPSVVKDRSKRLAAIEGLVPEDYDAILGCRFSNRCRYYKAGQCDREQALQICGEDHLVRCERYPEIGERA